MTALRFRYDFLSPYAFLAFTQIHRIAEARGRTVELAPTLLAGLLNAHGNVGPAEVAAKRTLLMKDVLRKAARYGVVVRPPATHPFRPLLALRAVLAAPDTHRRAITEALFRAAWGDGDKTPMDDPATVARAATEAGLDGNALVEATQQPEVKDALRASTEAAIEAGVFGVPTIEADGELFFGTDSLVDLEAQLDGQLAIDERLVELWATLPASASRK